MKRDMELVRKVLIKIEEHEKPMDVVSLKFDGVSDEAISYHVKLLADHGIIEALDFSHSTAFCWRAKRLTWDGHDFIDAIRDESRWNKVKAYVVDAGKMLTLETAKEAVKSLFL